jgi:tRNA A37 N6-isopentenylltransferase MiaA
VLMLGRPLSRLWLLQGNTSWYSVGVMDLAKSIIIAGPTTTGKSEISEMLARKVNGAIINTDNYYFYANDDFHIGLGLSKDEPPADIPCCLFGIREINEPKPNTEEFYQLVVGAAQRALAKGYIPIIQGCSFTLNAKLIDAGLTQRAFIPIWKNKDSLRRRCLERIQQMLDEGLIEEAKRIIEHQADSAWIAQEGIIYRPTIDYVKNGKNDLSKLINDIATGIIKKAEEQEVKYKKLKKVTWITHDNSPGEAFKQILSAL